jgi:hypothetical protein
MLGSGDQGACYTLHTAHRAVANQLSNTTRLDLQKRT